MIESKKPKNNYQTDLRIKATPHELAVSLFQKDALKKASSVNQNKEHKTTLPR